MYRLRCGDRGVRITHLRVGDEPALENHLWFDAEKSRTPQHQIGNFARFNRADILRDSVRDLELELAQSECTVTLTAPDPVVGHWDRERLSQVVANLLGNALKFGRGRPIEVSSTRVNGCARLTVRDHGIGIPAERVPFIFERFERAASSREYGGLGLGLYIVRAIVEAHGGSIHVESSPGHGATFTVDLPCNPP